MGFRMSCDWCGRFMKNLSMKDLKSMSDDNIVCPQCEKKIAILSKTFDKMKNNAQAEFTKLLAGYKSDFREAIQLMVENEELKGKKKTTKGDN